MLSLSPTIRIFLCLPVVDLRKSFDGLGALVRQALGDDPLSGHWFVFRNRAGDRLKSWPGRRTVIACGISDSNRESFASLRWPARDRPVSRSAPPSWPCCWTASFWRRCNAANAITALPLLSDLPPETGPPPSDPVSLHPIPRSLLS